MAGFRQRAERAAKLEGETSAAMAALRIDLGEWAKTNGIDATGDQLALPLLDRMSSAHRHSSGEGLAPVEAEFSKLEARAADLVAKQHELDTLHNALRAELPAMARRLRQSPTTLDDKLTVPLVADSPEAVARQNGCSAVKVWFDGVLNVCVLVESSCRLAPAASGTASQWLVSCHYECIELRARVTF